MAKEFTIRELTIRGWKRREDLDFKDDGTKFKAFEYTNGLIATYTKSNGEYYLALRVDYLDGLTYDEYSKMESYKLTDEFNGVVEVDADKVTENAIKIMEEYNNMVTKMEDYEVDMEKLYNAMEKELTEVYKILAETNITLDDIVNISSYEIKDLNNYRNSVKRLVEGPLARMEAEEYTKMELRNLEHRLNQYGYININIKDSFYIKRIREIANKAKQK